MQTVKSLDMLRKSLAELRADGSSIGLVPTMGALHEGHLTLVREARAMCDHVVASIFVNPTQFGPNEDLDAYPRQLAEDSSMLDSEGVALLWAPAIETMYPHGFVTNISVSGVSEGFCGAFRPGHFDGVATVVCKLFNQVTPDVAFFGEKDFQQLAVIRAMARDLDLTRPHVEDIIGVPTVRESDGLAMSSRNRYLSPENRAAAAALPNAMQLAIAEIEAGQSPSVSLQTLQRVLLESGFDSVDYAAFVDTKSLNPIDSFLERPARLLVAARIGGTRLIDNMQVG
ncbi:pantoate--beta-alanine ligase [Altererythrobacter ishigakiensis]|uniref:Pantothenate synthetase n=1 Tax=Altererythrobacter ishigakiensis TaxID=476157 RepID=A0A562USD1_9SPHN|nr:pantoate--beta-alanine ligase [Altererythrobacter ishigakiensis]TWJ08520.1 pantothenate synthetase [Altererythrobacter ishigakiensis]